MRALFIAEKPSVARDVQAVYNKMGFKDDITFSSVAGHVLSLKSPEEYQESWGKPWNMDVLPMIPAKFEYKVTQKDLFQKIKKEIESGKYDYIINACDAAREGELIFYSLYKHLGTKLPVKRFWASDTTAESTKKALNNLIDDKDPSLTALKASASYRGYFDWLIGMNLSRAVTLKTGAMIPCGRVMTPTLNIVVQRELEIKNFKVEDFYEIEGDFGSYKGLWFNKDTNETRFKNKKDAEAFIAKLPKNGTVESIEAKEEKEYAPTLHSLLELQKEANKAFGYTADKTLEIAQSLYEKRKLLTYPRTDSRYLPKSLASEITDHLYPLMDMGDVGIEVTKVLKDPKMIDRTVKSTRYVNDSKVTDHHAIIPTKVKADLSALPKEELNIYTLVVKRFVSIFLDPYIVNKTTIITDLGGEKFRTTGKTLVDIGYKVLHKSNKKDDIIPSVKKGEAVAVKKLNLLAGQTTPPERYNDATLLQAMQNAGKFVDDEELKNILKESAGLGTSATRAETIKKLVDRKMLERKGKAIIPTDFGISVIDILKDQDIISPELTAVWEDKLLKIEALEYDIKAFYTEMLEYIKEVTIKIQNELTGRAASTKTLETVGKCPKCGADVVLGKKYYLCKNYKNQDASKACDFLVGKTLMGANIPKAEMKKILSGKETKEMEFTWKSGKKGNAKLKYENGKINFIFDNSKK